MIIRNILRSIAKRGKAMSVATYTDGSYTIYGQCYCGITCCNCGSVRHFTEEVKKMKGKDKKDMPKMPKGKC